MGFNLQLDGHYYLSPAPFAAFMNDLLVVTAQTQFKVYRSVPLVRPGPGPGPCCGTERAAMCLSLLILSPKDLAQSLRVASAQRSASTLLAMPLCWSRFLRCWCSKFQQAVSIRYYVMTMFGATAS